MNSDTVRVAVRWKRMKPKRNADYDCVIGKHIKISPMALQDYSATLLTAIQQDLVVIAGAVAYADRMVRRKRAKGWARTIDLTVPVSSSAFWNKPEIMTALLDAIEYVSGDHWTIHPVQGPADRLAKEQTSLDFRRSNYVVLPFSDGLDSFLQWQLLKMDEPSANILRVHTSSRASNRSRNDSIDAHGDKADQRLAMPVSFSVGQHAEPTYRTRTFLFFVMAALAAHKFKTGRVVIGENGVGMLGPGMVPFGDECPHRTTHPAFTRRLSVFVSRVLGSRIEFEHPQKFRTKGQVLDYAVRRGVDGWRETYSCTRSPRNQLNKKPCGVCGGCLLRRTAVHAAGLSDGEYFWGNLSGESLDDCRSDQSDRHSRPSDIDIAHHGILDMSALAALKDGGTADDVIEKAAWDVVEISGAPLEKAAERISGLVETHAAEWEAFRAKFSVTGFLNAGGK